MKILLGFIGGLVLGSAGVVGAQSGLPWVDNQNMPWANNPAQQQLQNQMYLNQLEILQNQRNVAQPWGQQRLTHPQHNPC